MVRLIAKYDEMGWVAQIEPGYNIYEYYGTYLIFTDGEKLSGCQVYQEGDEFYIRESDENLPYSIEELEDFYQHYSVPYLTESEFNTSNVDKLKEIYNDFAQRHMKNLEKEYFLGFDAYFWDREDSLTEEVPEGDIPW